MPFLGKKGPRSFWFHFFVMKTLPLTSLGKALAIQSCKSVQWSLRKYRNVLLIFLKLYPSWNLWMHFLGSQKGWLRERPDVSEWSGGVHSGLWMQKHFSSYPSPQFRVSVAGPITSKEAARKVWKYGQLQKEDLESLRSGIPRQPGQGSVSSESVGPGRFQSSYPPSWMNSYGALSLYGLAAAFYLGTKNKHYLSCFRILIWKVSALRSYRNDWDGSWSRGNCLEKRSEELPRH